MAPARAAEEPSLIRVLAQGASLLTQLPQASSDRPVTTAKVPSRRT